MAQVSQLAGADPVPILLSSRVMNLSGMLFGRLTAEYPVEVRSNKHVIYRCLCSCGNRIFVTNSNLRSGHTQSCGCQQKEKTSAANRTHGKSKTKTYQRWCQMIQRCHKPYAPNYQHYGQRGIYVCDRWRESFENFLEDMGEAPDGMWLERVDNNGPYDPTNCVWATPSEQGENTRRSRFIEAGGRRQSLSAWAREAGVNPETIRKRLKRGWSPQDAVHF